jgi:dihydrofolate reductase
MFADYWPSVTEGDEKPFADKLNRTPKVVFSQTLTSAPWGSGSAARVVRDGAADEVAKLKRQTGKDMVIWGSISLTQHLIDKGLVDEYRLVICPVVLGSGRPLFRDDRGPMNLELVNGKMLDRGGVSLTYVQVHAHSARPVGVSAR